MEEEKKRESRSFQVSQDVLRHLHLPDKLEILNMARYHSSWTDAMREASTNMPIILHSMADESNEKSAEETDEARVDTKSSHHRVDTHRVDSFARALV